MITLQKLLDRGAYSAAGCLLWTGAVNSSGYGHFRCGTKTIKVHRARYELEYGSIPNNLYVCHKCDVRNCFNIEHLFLGTARDNQLDCMKKGRYRGLHGSMKFTFDELLEMRDLVASGRTQKEVALLAGISRPYLCQILKGNRAGWRSRV
jgi:hypothetical protein